MIDKIPQWTTGTRIYIYIYIYMLKWRCRCSFLCFPSFLLNHLSIRDKKGESTRKCTRVFLHFYKTHVHILRGRNSISCTFVGGESHRRDAYAKGDKTFFMRKPCFYLFYFMLGFSLFMVLWVMFSIYALLLSSHCAFVLDMHTSLCYCALLVACLDDHFLFHMIIVVISIWLFCV